MPSKHIDQVLWTEIEKKTVEAVAACNIPLTTGDILKFLIIQGLVHFDSELIREQKSKGAMDYEALMHSLRRKKGTGQKAGVPHTATRKVS